MLSFAFQWMKQAPNGVNAPTSDKHSPSHSARKIAPLKEKRASKIANAVRSKKQHDGDRPYDTLSATKSALELQPRHDRRLCSVRAGIATFIVVVVLIIAAGVALGIVFGAINPLKSSKTGSGSSSNQNSITTVSTGLLTSSIRIGSQNGVPCSGYTEIDDPTRNVANVASTSSCDNGPIFNTSSGAAWIRFVGASGTALAQSSPGINHCGGFLAGWLNGSLLIPMNTPTNGTVCFETYIDTCAWSLDTSIVWCSPGNFFVFLLPPLPFCNARYCAA